MLARGISGGGARVAGEYGPVQYHWPSGDERAVRNFSRLARRDDADRQARRRCDRVVCGRRMAKGFRPLITRELGPSASRRAGHVSFTELLPGMFEGLQLG